MSDSTSLDSFVQDSNDTGWTKHEVVHDSSELSPIDHVERKDTRMRLDSLMEKLSPDERNVLKKHYQEGQSFAEIGRDMSKSREWISKLHKRAIVVLRDWWDYEKRYGLRLTDLRELLEEREKISKDDGSEKNK